MIRLAYFLITFLGYHDGKEPTDRLVPPGYVGNPWGPAATKAREAGELPPIVMTPTMTQWDKWGRAVLKDGDIVFRRGDARMLFGRFHFSRFIALVSGSEYSHTAIVAIEKGTPVVYDSTKAGVRRQPFSVWVLDNTGPVGVKRLRPDLKSHIPGVVAYCRKVFEAQVPFDFDLGLDDSALYCVEMTEKAFRSEGLVLSSPVKMRDMENFYRYPIRIMIIRACSRLALGHVLSLDQAAWFPGNERHGIWSSQYLVTIFPPPPTADAASRKPVAAR
jgi:hypothetical protein